MGSVTSFSGEETENRDLCRGLEARSPGEDAVPAALGPCVRQGEGARRAHSRRAGGRHLPCRKPPS